MAWFNNRDEAAALIGVDPVSIEEINLANAASIVEIFIDKEPEDKASMGSRDLRRIQKAIAWQAIFIQDQPDYGYRTLLDSASQDGQSMSFVKGGTGVNIAAQMLHPVAYRALLNLSWLRGPLVPKSLPPVFAFTNESSDAYGNWRDEL